LFAFQKLVGMTDQDFSLLMTINGCCGAFAQAALLKILTRCGCSNLTIMLFAFVVDTGAYAGNSLLALFPFKALVFALSAARTLNRVYGPAFDALSTQGVKDDKGFVLGAFAAVDNITSVMSPVLMALVYQISPVAPFIVAILVNCLCILLVSLLRRRVKRESLSGNLVSTGA